MNSTFAAVQGTMRILVAQASNAIPPVSGATVAPSTANAAETISSATSIAPTGFSLILSKIEWFIVVPGVYLALAFGIIMLIVHLAKIFRAPQPPYQLALYPKVKHPVRAAMRDAFGMEQIRKQKPLFWVFLVIFHVGLIGILLGHLDILPEIHIVSESSRNMVGAGVFGLMVTIPVFYFIGRRFKSPVREISTPGDYILLLLFLFTFLLGDLMSWGNSWTATGFVMTKADFAHYFDGLLRFTFEDPRVYLHGTHYHMLVLHVLLADAMFIVLPFSKVVHAFLSIPANKIRRLTWNKK